MYLDFVNGLAMKIFCYIQLDNSKNSITYCNYCINPIYCSEDALISKEGKYFCCWDCIEEYDMVQRAY